MDIGKNVDSEVSFDTGPSRRKVLLKDFIFKYSIWFILVAVYLVFHALTGKFLSSTNLLNIIYHGSVLGVVAIGESICLLTGKFDLSVGSIVALIGSIAAWLMVTDQPGASGLGLHPVFAVLAILAVGIGLGFFNGFFVGKIGMNPMLTTLSTMFVFRGLALVVTSGQTLYGLPTLYCVWGRGKLGPIPIAIIIMLLLYLLFYFILKNKKIGRHIYAVGGNPTAARECGIRVERTIIYAYLLSGLLAAVAGILSSGRLGAAHSRAGEGLELQAIAAAVIGGISLSGGRGSIIGTIGGVLVLSAIDSGLVLLKVPSFWVQAVTGMIIFIAIFVDTIKTKFYRVD